MGMIGFSIVLVLRGLFRDEEKHFCEKLLVWSVPVLSVCFSKLTPWNKNPPALIQSHPAWGGGGDGLGGSWEVFPALQSGICQELKVPRAPEALQVGMLVWSSPVDVVSIPSGGREVLEVLPKLRNQ